MNKYEGLFIFSADSGADARAEEFKKLDDLFSKHKANVLEKAEWGKKTLGYAIHKRIRSGYLLVVHFEMDPAQTAGFQKDLNLESSLLKYMLTSLEEKKGAQKIKLPTAPKKEESPAEPVASA